MRVLTSADGSVWQSSALVSVPGADLRDPKLSTTSYNRLLLLAEAVSDAGRAAPWRGPRRTPGSGKGRCGQATTE